MLACQYHDGGDRTPCGRESEYKVTLTSGFVRFCCWQAAETYIINMCKGDKITVEKFAYVPR